MSRYLPFALSIVLATLSFVLAWTWPWWWAAFMFFSATFLLGLLDMRQSSSSLRRNYPILAHFRYGLESIGPEIRQYFVQTDKEEVPFSRLDRAMIYQRSKNLNDVVPFGTQMDVFSTDYEWINHSLAPAHNPSHDFRVLVGGSRCKHKYSASVLNISAMSFGSLSANAIRALNNGARKGHFYHDTGEGSISMYHREGGGDLVWQIASGYFGCRDEQGHFSEERFIQNAQLEQVKMIEVKLSQGAKPGHGGMLPGRKVNAEIAITRGIPQGVDCISPAAHSAFSTPLELLQFIEKLRTLSGGKPVGFKLAIGHPWEWFGIAKAMQETGLLPDFIVVDGAEGGTGAAPPEFSNSIGVPMNEALLLVHNTLVGLNIRDQIRIGAAGKITSAFGIARTIAMGADWVNAARGFMFALGCIQSLSCHTDKCPTGIATQDRSRWKHLDATDKATRVFNFHENTLKALRDILGAAGLVDPSQLGPEHIIRRINPYEVRSFATLYPFLQPGALLSGEPAIAHGLFRTFWHVARSDSFAPPPQVAELQRSKLF
ncbi:FMN-binding glutamate synthase family protein [Lampropedia puyangensis]|uniref:FMN-binding glutamate synthase family protein n=1 Tax=Lampropedia puyangensis TaxID=1330072 RepID=A0A4S8FAZ3_9BURK|nr:FMN-binding glutamate synthase family protein [Lampropedia puyangensis]THU04457.1 FMN-binding glutamate synthase family protein [Lampropedia puyangensis]